MNRRDFLDLAAKSVAAATALPTIALPTATAASAAVAPVFDASLTGLFANWINAARLMFDERMPELVKDHPITAHNYQRALRSVDNSKKSWRTRIPPEHENHPAMKALLDIYDAEMQRMRSITDGKPPTYTLTSADIESASETVRVSWESFVKIAQRYPELNQIANEILDHNIKFKNQVKPEGAKRTEATQRTEKTHAPEKMDAHAAKTQPRTPNWDLLSSDSMQVYEDINRVLGDIAAGSGRSNHGR